MCISQSYTYAQWIFQSRALHLLFAGLSPVCLFYYFWHNIVSVIHCPTRLAQDPEDFDLDQCAAWIHEQLFAESAPERKVKLIVEDGRLEVEGKPSDGRAMWDVDELEGVRADRHDKGVHLGSRRWVWQGSDCA